METWEWDIGPDASRTGMCPVHGDRWRVFLISLVSAEYSGSEWFKVWSEGLGQPFSSIDDHTHKQKIVKDLDGYMYDTKINY